MDVQFGNGDWTEVTVDSAAEESVCPRGWGTQYGIKPVDERNKMYVRIDGNELWIDIAVQPVKAIEFIYIPIRIQNTGADLNRKT